MKVTVWARVYPTEDAEKVKEAVGNILDVEMEMEGDGLVGTGDNLDRLHEILRRFKVLDSARRILLRNMGEMRTHLDLNKQAAYMGKINFSSTSPLGPIEVSIEDDDIQGTIDWLAPETVEGREVA